MDAINESQKYDYEIDVVAEKWKCLFDSLS